MLFDRRISTRDLFELDIAEGGLVYEEKRLVTFARTVFRNR